MKSKKCRCTDCTYYNGIDCTHTGNIGLRVKYRKEYTYYIKRPDELNAGGKCCNYAKV